MISLTMFQVKQFWATFINEQEQSMEIESVQGNRWKLIVHKYVMDYGHHKMKLYLPSEDTEVDIPFLVTVNGNNKLFKIVKL